MKVAHLVPAMEQGGVETVVCEINRALVKAGCESLVVSAGGALAGRIKGDGGRHVELDLKSKNPFSYFRRARALRELLRAEKPDLVCAHSRVPAWLFVQANRRLGIRWITHAHGANSVSRYSAVMTKGDLTVTPSRFLAGFLMANYRIPESRIRVVPNAVDAGRFDPARVDAAFVAEKRREWGVEPGDHVTMAIGRISPVKGFDELIKSFADGAAADPHRKLVIVGGADRGRERCLARLKNLAAALAPGKVVFAGHQTRIPECIAVADEVVSANTVKPESFGLSIIEAYAMNKPVRAKRFGGAAEVMDAVAASGAPSYREAVLRLYGAGQFAERILAVYREAVNMV